MDTPAERRVSERVSECSNHPLTTTRYDSILRMAESVSNNTLMGISRNRISSAERTRKLSGLILKYQYHQRHQRVVNTPAAADNTVSVIIIIIIIMLL